jgi:demethylmenaquinone methyltransferase/2-methoxy-6-polyprenyl-1,4-benzoquinol methylase
MVRGMMRDTPESLHESPMQPEGDADFGFRKVPVAAKKGMVREVFDSVASKYDLMNDLMSLGVHRLWKDAFVDWLNPRPGQHLLDVAGGTGDIAFRFLDRTRKKAGGAPARVTVCDINQSMLSVGRDRAIDRGIIAGIDWVCGDAESLPVPSASVDCYTIAFGLRNVTHIDLALAEARRVLKPGGRMMCLEFSKVALPILEKPYDLYSFEVLPRLGSMVAGDAESYRYLAESIRRFPPQEELAARMRAVGLGQVKYRNLSGGIAAVHTGWRL